MLMDTVGSEMLLLFGKLGLRLGPLVPPRHLSSIPPSSEASFIARLSKNTMPLVIRKITSLSFFLSFSGLI